MSDSQHAPHLAHSQHPNTAPVNARGRHLLVDCRNVPKDVCLDDKLVLRAMAQGAEDAGANVISQVRYKFGADSPPGFTAAIVLDESHCTAHSYADFGLIAMDVFTCGSTDPHDVLGHIRAHVDLGDVTITEVPRFAGAMTIPGAEVEHESTGPGGEINSVCV